MPHRFDHEDEMPDDFGGNGTHGADDRREELRRKATMLVDAETGVRFDSLTLFADPLFELFDLDAAVAFALQAEPESADEITIAALEAARLFWAYFSLPANERDDAAPALMRNLLGPAATEDEEADFELLLDRIAEQWEMLTELDRRIAEDTPAPTLDFQGLLAHPLYEVDATAHSTTYGPDELSETEARALFAQPLLNEATDLDEMADAMDRAAAYWELAHAPPDSRAERLEALLATLSHGPPDRAGVREEAQAMLKRFEELFPERR